MAAKTSAARSASWEIGRKVTVMRKITVMPLVIQTAV